MQTALVTGANGFIGFRLCKRLKASGYQVLAAVRHPMPEHGWPTLPLELDGKSISLAGYKDIDVIYHLAGKAHALSESRRDEQAYFQINTEGTKKLLEAAQKAGVRRFVLFSSVKAMGEGTGCEAPLDESAPCKPQTPYGRSKLAAERLVLEGGYVPEPVVLRLSMVYGPTDKGNLPRMIRAVAQGRFPPLPDTGNKRSLVHVDDVVAAAILAAEKSKAIGQVFIVTDGTPYATRQIYEWICAALHKPVPMWSLPMAGLKAAAKLGDGIGWLIGRRFVIDSDSLDKLLGSAWYASGKIEKDLGFKPQRHLRASLPEIARYLALA